MTPRYRLDERLGAGAMGVVYRAFDTRLERSVALKVLKGAVLDAGGHVGVLREARAASALSHPNVAVVHEVSEYEGEPCIVMEYVDGTSLRDAIPPEGLPSADVIRYGIQIASALAHAHERGIIHRDLKSANVILTSDDRVKVLDFGLAQRVREAQVNAATVPDAVSPDAVEGGTLAYMSPQTLEGGAAGPGDDVWSLGVLLYEMAAGELPFDGASRYQLVTSILRDSPQPLPKTVPPGLAAVIHRCLAKQRGCRYQQAHEVRAALDALGADAGLTDQPSFPLHPRVLTITMGTGALILAIALATANWTRQSQSAASAAEPVSVAVLPFANPDGDSELDYVTEGIPESVISSLARVPGKLKVISMSAVQRYRGARPEAGAVGRTLNVAAVLYGSVVERNGVVSVAVELVSTADQSRIWGGTYHKPRRDLVAVHADIATQISAALRVELSGDEQQALRKHYPSNPDAFPLLLKGHHHWSRSTPDDFHKSLKYFQQAIQLDNRYALAHVGLARVLSSMTYEGLLPPSASREVYAAASTALSLDDTLGAAHGSLAGYWLVYAWDWDAAEAEFTSALTLSPRDEAVHRYYGIFLRTQRRWDEAVAAMKQALALNPVSADAGKALGATYVWAGQTALAIQQYKATLEIDPTNAQTHDLLADAYAAAGMYREALEARRTYLRYEGALGESDRLGTDGTESGYRAGMRGLYTRYLDALRKAAAAQYVSPMEFALIYVGLGEKDRAFEMLERAFGERAPWLSNLAADPAFDPIRSDPRFTALLARVGIPYRR